MSTFDPGNRLIGALEVPDRERALTLAEKLSGQVAMFKIGIDLFLAEGPDLVRWFTERGLRVMLDMKLHDAPATVTRATRRVAALGVDLLSVHAGGGRDMLAAAVWAAAQTRRPGKPPMGILAVTVLTSLDQSALGQVGVVGRVDDVVALRARAAQRAGCLGVITSPREAKRVRNQSPEELLIVTPGIRPGTSSVQRSQTPRITTPWAARRAGADLLVCGRPLRDADDPAVAAQAMVADIEAATRSLAAQAATQPNEQSRTPS